MKISERIRHAIETSGKSRYAIAKESGVAESQLSRFVNDKRQLSLDAVDTLAEYFGLELRQVRRGRK